MHGEPRLKEDTFDKAAYIQVIFNNDSHTQVAHGPPFSIESAPAQRRPAFKPKP
jgi:hypothetical protein